MKNNLLLKIGNFIKNKDMTTEQFKNYCNQQGYTFEEVNDRLVVTTPYSFDLGNFKKLPKNLTFKNNGYVNIPNVEEISESTIFENTGDVYMKDNVIIPEGYKGFKNTGNIRPENLKFKTPNVKFQYSNEMDLFISENNENKYVKKLQECNYTYLTDKQEQVTLIDFAGPDEVAFLPIRNLIKLYKKAIVDDETIQKGGLDNWINRNRTTLYKESAKNTAKVGRFLTKLFPEITDVEKEEFANLYKSFKSNNEYEFELLKGEDIIKAYYRGNQDTKQGTTLYNSCMNWQNDTDTHPHNHRNIKKMLEFYSKNPNCELLTLRFKNAKAGETHTKVVVEQDPNNPIKLKKDGTPDKRYKNHAAAIVKEEIVQSDFRKIRGRALVWHDTERNIHYMEYVYTVRGTENVLYENYAKEKGWVTNNNRYDTDMNKLYKKIKIPVPKEIADKGRISDSKDLPTYLDSLSYDDINKIVKAQ
jgi:hypothetical protein